ncbi:hypothetical protein A7J71_18135 [Achromobacter insolitus]|uniref:sulfur carrier protein ThiS n=1 Tax=Achromobacter insolitus TaxID=217204 RepID=UPI0007C737F7|nr:MoaD/ThiS family protein [Achromobacter insolitus]OAE52887.1 hypothetical protein A7J71_18135 [Achromobacter insolitus]OCZ50627.1 hypothetical protein A7P22_15205 [Achromobacter insolitus]
MPIKVYPSLLPGEPIEVHDVGSTTVGAWLESLGIEHRKLDVQPIQVSLNGARLPPTEWEKTVFCLADEVEIRIVPHGGVFKALGSIIGKVFNLAFGWLTPRNSASSGGAPQQGERLEASQATANRARLGEVVPELAGRFRKFPDYLTPPRRYFADKREQWIVFLANVGPGNYEILPDDVRVGQTPFDALGADASYQIFPPGADLTGYVPAEIWHTSDAVGGTSSGTAGLDLTTEPANRVNTDPASYSFAGSQITRSVGEFPSGWGADTLVQVEFPTTYTIVDFEYPPTESQPGYVVSRITGYFGHLASLSVGAQTSLGAFDVWNLWQIRTIVAAPGGGIWTLEFQTVPGGVPIRITPGTSTLTFAAIVTRAITAFSDGAITVSPGNFGTVPSLATRVRFAGGAVYGEWTSEFIATPDGSMTSLLELDVFFPRGLCELSDEGDVESRSVAMEYQYRSAAGGPRTTVRFVYSDATVDQIGFTERIAIPSMVPSVRARRVGAQSTSTQINDVCQWYGLKARLPDMLAYPNWTTLGVKLRSGGRLGAQSENQINVVATRVLPVLGSDGLWQPAQPTRDISAFVRYIAHSIGYTDADLDMDELLRLHNVWVARGETLDYVYDETTVKEALNLALGAGMAELTIHDGQIVPVRDDVRTQFEQPYSPQNMTGPLRRSFRSRRIDDADGVEVEFTNAQTWTQETVKCLLPGDAGFKLEKIQIKGVTDRTRAWRIGMRRRRILRYRNWQYAFATEMDALNSRYLSYVPLIDGDPGYGMSAILEHIEPSGGLALLHVSEPLEWSAGEDHVIAFRRPDGSLAGPFNATPGPDEYSVLASITEPWPAISLKQEPPHVYFGTVDRWSFPALITNITPRGLAAANVEAENYDVRVYASDNEVPPA